MNGMKIGKQIEIETLNLKFKTESLEVAEQQLKDGKDDLHFRLSHFRKRVLDKEKYDKQFFGTTMKSHQQQVDNLEKGLVVFAAEELPVLHERKKKDKWLKTIYRKIVASTHPDKFQNFPVESLKQKYLKIYLKTISSWEKEEDDQILLCAYESDIQIENPKALPILMEGNKQKNARLKEIQALLAYQWYHVPEKDKTKVLEDYLKKLGYEFTAQEVEKVVHLARKRKVGTRPKNLRKLKNVK
jgi:hypothetical protein